MYNVADFLRNTVAQEGQTAVVPKGALVRRSSHRGRVIFIYVASCGKRVVAVEVDIQKSGCCTEASREREEKS
jgi:hypothetical protein